MTDLDDKLRQIDVYVASEDIYTPLDDEAIAQIKQAFEEADYRQVPRQVTVSSVEEAMKIHEERIPDMTGQEWYDRFEKELSQEIYGDTNPTDRVDCESIPYPCTCDLLEAAKRAAGLEDAKS